MKLSIEKRPANNEEPYFVFTHNEGRFEMAANAAKAILLLWVFAAVVIFSFIVGEQTVSQQNMMTAYLARGNLTNEQGQPVSCNPVLTEKRSVEWNCTTENVTNPAAVLVSQGINPVSAPSIAGGNSG